MELLDAIRLCRNRKTASGLSVRLIGLPLWVGSCRVDESRSSAAVGRDPKFKNQIARPHTIHRNMKRAKHANGRRRAGHSRSGISVHDTLLPVTSMKSLQKEDSRFNGGCERHTPTAPRWRVGNSDHQRMRDLDQRDTLRKAVCLLLVCAHFCRRQALPCQCVMKQIGTSL